MIPAGSRLLPPEVRALVAPSSTVSLPRGFAPYAIQCLREDSTLWPGGTNSVPTSAPERTRSITSGSRPVGVRARAALARDPAGADAARRAARDGNGFAIDIVDDRHAHAAGVADPFDVREDHQPRGRYRTG